MRTTYRGESFVSTTFKTFRRVADTTGCKYKFAAGPTQTFDGFLYGVCDECGNQVAVAVDDKGNETGESWLVEPSENVTARN